jgi:hypothetical protein
MSSQAIDLSGTYVIASVDATGITFVDPHMVNPSWSYVDLDGSGGTGYTREIGISLAASGYPVDLGGTYTIAAVTPTQIALNNPEASNSDWGWLSAFAGAVTRKLSSTLTKSFDNWQGPYIVEAPDTALLVSNFVAMGGLFKDDGKKQVAFPVTVQLEATPVNELDIPIGPPQLFNGTLEGNTSGRELRAVTLVCELTTPGRHSVRARRLTNTDYNYKGTVIDEVKWEDLYGVAEVDVPHFGDVTTVHARTYATAGATAQKDRKLNCRVSRRLLVRNPDNTFGPAREASDNAADIICNMALDPYIGGRTLSEIDVQQIYDTVTEVQDYFGFSETGHFNYTFDQDNISFEEMAQTVAQAVFCTAYRQGNRLRLLFEKATPDSTMLFNHRNKIPGSETRTIRFGHLEDTDGVEFDYVSSADGSQLTFYIPEDRSATRPKKIEGIGVSDGRAAFLHAARAWNKIRYQHTAVEFDATSEASQLVRTERIEVTDNTRPDVYDGHVEEVAGLVLKLSQPFTAEDGVDYVIFLQLPTDIVEAISILPGSDEHHVILQAPPSIPLIVDPEIWADTVYQIVGSTNVRSSAFLVTEKGVHDRKTVPVQAINYDPRYYQDDLTYNS